MSGTRSPGEAVAAGAIAEVAAGQATAATAAEAVAGPQPRGTAMRRPSGEAAARRRKLLGESAFLYSSVYVYVFFKFVSGLLVAKFLGPGLYGLRAAFGLVLEYEPYTQLGLNQAMQREVPFHRGKGDAARARRVQANVFGGSMLLSGGFCVALVIGALYCHRAGAEQILVDFLLFLAVYTVFSRVRSFYAGQLVIDKRTNAISQLRLLTGATNAVFSVALVYLFSLRGLFVGLFAAQLVQVLFLLWKVRWIPPRDFSPRFAAGLIRIGLPIMLISIFSLLFKNVDKMLILGMLSKEMLGYFAVAVILSKVAFESVADVFRVMFFPRLMEKIGRSTDLQEVRPYLTEPTVLIAYAIPFMIGALFLSIHLPVTYFAPEYLPAVPVAKVLMLAQFFFAVATIPLLVCVGLNQQRQVIQLTCAAIGLDALLNYTFLRAGWGIEGVALGTGLSYCALGTLATLHAFRQFGVDWRGFFRFYALVLLPFFYSTALLLAMDLWLPAGGAGLGPDLFAAVWRVVAYCLLFSLVLLVVRSRPAVHRLLELLPRASAGVGPLVQRT